MCVLRQVSLLPKVSPLLPNFTGGRSHFPQNVQPSEGPGNTSTGSSKGVYPLNI